MGGIWGVVAKWRGVACEEVGGVMSVVCCLQAPRACPWPAAAGSTVCSRHTAAAYSAEATTNRSSRVHTHLCMDRIMYSLQTGLLQKPPSPPFHNQEFRATFHFIIVLTFYVAFLYIFSKLCIILADYVTSACHSYATIPSHLYQIESSCRNMAMQEG